MGVINEKKAQYICDACEKEVFVWHTVYGNMNLVNGEWQYPEGTPVLCAECKVRAAVWAAKQSLGR